MYRREKVFQQAFMISSALFILINSNDLFAASQAMTFEYLTKKIQQKGFCELKYNPEKSAALVSVDCGSVVYISFKTRKVFPIVNNLPNVFITWLSNDIAHIQSPCGTGCSNSIIFAAPGTILTCPVHEYRIKNINENEPPDYYNNTPLSINVKKRVYTCYGENNKIRSYSLKASK